MGVVPDEPANQREPQSSSRTDAHPPMPRDKRGWQVAPAPDGRGMPEQPPSGPPAHRRPGFIWFVLVLLVINWLSLFLIHPSSGQQRVPVQFKPFFLTQVQAGKVKSISSKGDTIEGTLKQKVSYPAHDKNAQADDAVLDAGPDLLEQRAAHRAAERKERQHHAPSRRAKATRCSPSCCSASARRC